MITNDLTHGIAFENLAHEDADEDRPRSNSLPPVVQFADDSDHSDKEVCCIDGLGGKRAQVSVCLHSRPQSCDPLGSAADRELWQGPKQEVCESGTSSFLHSLRNLKQ